MFFWARGGAMDGGGGPPFFKMKMTKMTVRRWQWQWAWRRAEKF